MSTKQKEERMTQSTNYQKPVPIPDEASHPFFDGARERRLMIQQCTTCGAVMWQVEKHNHILVRGNGGVLNYHSSTILSKHPA